MTTEFTIWIVVAGVVGLAIGFVIGYFALRRTADRHGSELTSLRAQFEDERSQLEQAEQRLTSLNRRVEEKDQQIRAAHDEINHLERTLEEKGLREKKAIDALRDAFHEDVNTSQRRVNQQEADQARRRAEAHKVAEEDYRTEQVDEPRRK
jgi:uncharacterized membrane-anchored protein YhcB (DUF1043 family)